MVLASLISGDAQKRARRIRAVVQEVMHDHGEYLKLDGSRAMTGNLDIGLNSLIFSDVRISRVDADSVGIKNAAGDYRNLFALAFYLTGGIYPQALNADYVITAGNGAGRETVATGKAGSGAGTARFQLNQPQLAGNLEMDSNNARDIGSASAKIANLYAVNTFFDDVNFLNKWKITELGDDLLFISPKGKKLRLTEDGFKRC